MIEITVVYRDSPIINRTRVLFDVIAPYCCFSDNRWKAWAESSNGLSTATRRQQPFVTSRSVVRRYALRTDMMELNLWVLRYRIRCI